MRSVMVVLVALCVGSAWAAREQGVFRVFAETRVRRVALMPLYQPPRPGVPEEEQQTASEAIAGGRPVRMVEARLWSPGIAPPEARASLELPAGLEAGRVVDLTFYRPKPGQTKPEAPVGAAATNYTLKLYWGSSPTVPRGQPRTLRFSDLTGEQQAALRRLLAEVPLGPLAPQFLRPDWTVAYWPGTGQPQEVRGTASLIGRYALTTNYAGSAVIADAPGQNFLPPMTLTTPDLTKRVALERALALEWGQAPRLVGQHAMVLGTQGTTLIVWTATGAGGDPFRDWAHLDAVTARTLVRRGVLLGPRQTRVTAPAGIFANVDRADLVLIGYGPDVPGAADRLRAGIETKTTLLAALGGKSLPGVTTHVPESEQEERQREERQKRP